MVVTQNNILKGTKINIRQIIYTLCFVFIAIIDWIRGSQKGVDWNIAVNTIGFIMTILFVMQYSWKHETKKPYIIWLIIWGIGACIGYIIWLKNPFMIYKWQYITGAIAAGCLGITAIRAWREQRKAERSKIHVSFLMIIWSLMSVLMLLSRRGEIWQIWFFSMFALFFMVPMAKEEQKTLWDGLANGLIIAFFIIQIFAFGFKPYDEVRYKGFYAGCNINALFYLVTYIMVLYRIHDIKWKEKRNLFLLIFYYVLAGGLISFTFFTISRTALLVLVALTFSYGIISNIIVYKHKIKMLIIQWFVIGLSAICTLPCVYLSIRYLPTILHHPVWWEGEYSEDKIHSFDPWNSDKYISFETFLENAVGRINYDIIFNLNPKNSSDEKSVTMKSSITPISASVSNKIKLMPTKEIEENYILSGADVLDSGKIRLEIYKLYWKNLNMTGHKLTDGFFQITKNYHAWHAQNVFLQVAFYYGIPAGILFLILMIGFGIQSLRQLFKRRNSTDILPIMVWVVFIGFGMLESVWYPGQVILFLMYLTPKIMIDEKGKHLMIDEK